VLEKKTLVPAEVIDARREPLAGEAAWQVLASAREILVATGKQYQVFHPRTDARETILAHALGRTGNLRAPALRIGDRLLVGFSDALYAQLAGGQP
jgi:hypothetical protein